MPTESEVAEMVVQHLQANGGEDEYKNIYNALPATAVFNLGGAMARLKAQGRVYRWLESHKMGGRHVISLTPRSEQIVEGA